jgi:hypothetical protein
MAIVQSNKCLFQVLVGNDYKSVMCLRSFSVNPVTTEKETTTPIDGKFKDFDYAQLSLRASLDGVAYRETTGDTLYDFAEQQLNFVEINFRALFLDEAGNYKIFKGQAIVMDCSFEASAGNVASGTVELLCKGAYTIENDIPQFVNLRIRLYNDPAAQGFFKLWLIDPTGQPVFQTDVLPQASGGNLANPLDITVPVPKGSWYYWFQFTTNDIGNVFSLNAPPTKTTNFNNGVFNESSFPTQLYDFTANREVSIALGINNPPPTCVAPAVQSGIVSPNGEVGTYYSRTVVLSGSQPFVISNVVKPGWMALSIAGNIVTLEGNPTAGVNQDISFDITNACGSASYATTIDIAPGAANIVVNYNYVESPANSSYFTIYVNSILRVSLTSTGSGSITVNTLDIVEAFVGGAALVVKHLDIQDSVSGELFNQTNGSSFINASFGAQFGHTYTINGNGNV